MKNILFLLLVCGVGFCVSLYVLKIAEAQELGPTIVAPSKTLSQPATRTMHFGTAIGSRGGQVAVPVEFDAFGDETAATFSVSFDPTALSSPVVTVGPGAPAGSSITTNMNDVNQGMIGMLIDSANTFAPSPPTSDFAIITFNVAPQAPLGASVLSFGDMPTQRSTSDLFGNTVPTAYVDGVVNIQRIYGDVSSRPNGDGQLLSADVIVERQFVVGTQTPDANEFIRADVAPLASHGDGVLTAGDTIQVRRYVAGLDPMDFVPGTFRALRPVFEPWKNVVDDLNSIWTQRVVSVVQSDTSPAGKVVLYVDMDSQGDEAAVAFTLGFDPKKLANPLVSLAPDASFETVLTTNTAKSDEGQLAILVDTTDALANGRLVTITFDVVGNTAGETTTVAFTDAITKDSTADAEGNLLPTRFISGAVTIPRHHRGFSR
jgi:hypothetical protein